MHNNRITGYFASNKYCHICGKNGNLARKGEKLPKTGKIREEGRGRFPGDDQVFFYLYA